MRQLAIFDTADHARRLTAYLVTQRIAAHAEEDGGKFSIWVRDEDQMAAAREALDHFRANPGDPKYSGVETAAHALKRQQAAEREARQKNVVEMRSRWGNGPGGVRRKCPVTIGLIVASVLVGIATNMGGRESEPPKGLLTQLLVVEPSALEQSLRAGSADYFVSIRAGQIWRIFTPMLIHYGLPHLVFNMYWLFVLGGQIEDRRGWKHFVLLVLLLSAASNLASAIVFQWRDDFALAGGMSGVGYGIFGYLWMKVKFDPSAGYELSRMSIALMMIWFVLCILRDYPPFDSILSGLIPGRVDNVAHLVGLAIGMAAGYALLLLRRR